MPWGVEGLRQDSGTGTAGDFPKVFQGPAPAGPTLALPFPTRERAMACPGNPASVAVPG